MENKIQTHFTYTKGAFVGSNKNPAYAQVYGTAQRWHTWFSKKTFKSWFHWCVAIKLKPVQYKAEDINIKASPVLRNTLHKKVTILIAGAAPFSWVRRSMLPRTLTNLKYCSGEMKSPVSWYNSIWNQIFLSLKIFEQLNVIYPHLTLRSDCWFSFKPQKLALPAQGTCTICFRRRGRSPGNKLRLHARTDAPPQAVRALVDIFGALRRCIFTAETRVHWWFN